MAATKKYNIRRSIERHLIPALEARGFKRAPDNSESRDPLHNPYGRFRRHTGRGFDLIEIQFHKDRLSRFRLNLASAAGGEWPWPQAPIPLEDQWTAHVFPNYYFTDRGLVFRRWFGVRKLARQGITEGEYDAAVDKVIRLLPQVDRLFATGRPSRRMQRMPEGALRFLAYAGQCLLAVVIPVYFAAWLVGWLVRNL